MNENKQNYIKKIKGDIIPGFFNETIEFSGGLNIISGANGTGKTFLLKYIQQQRTNQDFVEFSQNNNFKNIATFDPKRNSEKKLIESAQQFVRQQNFNKQSAIQDYFNKQVQDNNFQTMKSISDYLILAYEDYRDGDNLPPMEAAKKVQTEYNNILQKVFIQYEIEFSWDLSNRKANFNIKKRCSNLQPNLLSSGENALMSLIFALFYGKDLVQVYLIDEPEIHLNWQLEEKLFEFLDWFSGEYKKQMIVVTHSRVCFIENFLQKTQFLLWDEKNKIEVVRYPTKEIIDLLSGDFVKIIGGITAKNKLVYVEDKAQEFVLNKISELLNLDLEIQVVGNSSKVVELSKSFKKLNIQNVYFLIDNDNKSIKDISETINLIQLKKYCIENYFLDEQILSKIDKKDQVRKQQKGIKILIKETITRVLQSNFVVIRKLVSQDIELTQDLLDRIDASQFIKDLSVSLGFSKKEELFDAYLEKLKEEGRLEEYLTDLSLVIN